MHIQLSTVGLLTQNINNGLPLYESDIGGSCELFFIIPFVIIQSNVNSSLKVLSQLEFFLVEVNPDKLSKSFCKCHNV